MSKSSRDAPAEQARDLSNAELTPWLWVAFIGTCVAMLVTGLLRVFYPEDVRPGSGYLHLTAVAGSLLLVGAWWSALAKRRGGHAKRGLRTHVILTAIGMTLVGAHTTAAFGEAPVWLIVLLVLLILQGTWARTAGARALASSFGAKPTLLAGATETTRNQLRELLSQKHTVLAELDAEADEATFVLSAGDWLRAPSAAWRYQRLVSRERAVIGAGDAFGLAQRVGRRLHQWLAWLFVVGLLVHVVLATFFAGYVAEGGEIYWWHITAWDF